MTLEEWKACADLIWKNFGMPCCLGVMDMSALAGAALWEPKVIDGFDRLIYL